MDATERGQLIERYAAGYEAVIDALQGITERELDHQTAGGWTPRQIVHHLADSETTSYIRVRRLLAEDQPHIQGYDEELFARTLHYDRPIATSLEVFRAVRRATVSLLERITEADWARAGTHSEQGWYGVEDWLAIYAHHGAEHAAQIRRARGEDLASGTYFGSGGAIERRYHQGEEGRSRTPFTAERSRLLAARDPPLRVPGSSQPGQCSECSPRPQY